MNKTLSIIIPTARFSKYLDIAIESCLKLKYPDKNIFVNINSDSKTFEKSFFWNDKRVKWRYIEKVTEHMYQSFNNAIENSFGDWIFLLSDDDYLLPNFLDDIDINQLDYKDLYAVRLKIVDSDNKLIRIQKPYKKKYFTKNEWLSLFFKQRIHNHASLFLFSRKMFEYLQGYSQSGYPNGYYMDTILHAKLLANCEKIICSEKINFSRRESLFQESSKFFFSKEVNNFFEIIVDQMFSDAKFKLEVFKRFDSKKKFKEFLIIKRFRTEWAKLNTSSVEIENKLFLKKELIFSFLMYWQVNNTNKVINILYAILFYFYSKSIRPFFK